MSRAREAFERVTKYVRGRLAKDEAFTLHFYAEDSDFVRFNHGQVRQPGAVQTLEASLRLIQGKRHASAQTTLTGNPEDDHARVLSLLDTLRNTVGHLPEDPYLLVDESPMTDAAITPNELPAAEQTVERIVRSAKGQDLVGIYAGGAISYGLSTSYGHNRWFTSHSFSFDYCLYHRADKAVKSTYAGKRWDNEAFAIAMHDAKAQLEVLKRPSTTLKPGKYRAFLTPAALGEIVGLLGAWDGTFGARAQQTKTSVLQRLFDGQARLSPAVSLRENTRDGIAPPFQADAFGKPDKVELLTRGGVAAPLVCPRSAREYGLVSNGAETDECPQSLEMDAGDLDERNALRALDTGLYVSNLWYLNYSDRNHCRMTGMTRFATLWVEKGQIVGPVNVMRFDDSVYSLLGDQLESLTKERAFMPNTDTYLRRSVGSMRIPGALVSELNLTL